MRTLTLSHLTSLLDGHQAPCISLYQSTHRRYPQHAQDPIRYRQLLRTLEASLRQRYTAREVAVQLKDFEALVDDEHFWKHRTEGLAILACPGSFQVFDLQRPVQDLAVVADSLHVKPLLRVVQSADRFQVLALSREKVRLFEGNRYAVDHLEAPDVPATMTAALGEELTEQHSGQTSVGGSAGSGGQRTIFHGQGQKKDEAPIDRERFFRVVDRAVLEQHSRPSGLPLLLVALAEHQGPFRALSHNPQLMPEGLTHNPDALSVEQLRDEAWKLVEPLYLSRLAKLVADFRLASTRQRGSDHLPEVAQAAVAGRVATLLVEADRQIPGTLDAATGAVRMGELSDPGVDDLLDDLSELVLRRKGDIVVVPAERMPSTTGLAATFRF